MSSSMLEQRSRFAMIGALISATKKYLEQVQTIEITCE